MLEPLLQFKSEASGEKGEDEDGRSGGEGR